MKLGRLRTSWQVTARFAAACALSAAAMTVSGQPLPSNAGVRDVTVSQFQQHLKDLAAIVDSCKLQRSANSTNAARFPACDPDQIGPDDRVHGLFAASSEQREVRYDWLRAVLTRAATKTGTEKKSLFGAISHSNEKPVPVNSLLSDASRRLQDDARQAETPLTNAPDYGAERKVLKSILSQRAYQGVTQVSSMDRFREWLDNLLDRFFGGLERLGENAPWIIWLLRILLIAGICIALIWILLRIDRRSRVKLVPDLELGSGAPSARDWQLWYKDAGAMAAQGRWREAIHFLYWASISLLESRRAWQADRARTPREYLALIAGTDPRKSKLTVLTRSFERTWYGGREATESEFHEVLELVRSLGVAAE